MAATTSSRLTGPPCPESSTWAAPSSARPGAWSSARGKEDSELPRTWLTGPSQTWWSSVSCFWLRWRHWVKQVALRFGKSPTFEWNKIHQIRSIIDFWLSILKVRRWLINVGRRPEDVFVSWRCLNLLSELDLMMVNLLKKQLLKRCSNQQLVIKRVN